jgi:hypothetical protein
MPALGEVMTALESVSSAKFETVPGEMTTILFSFITVLKECARKERENRSKSWTNNNSFHITFLLYFQRS